MKFATALFVLAAGMTAYLIGWRYGAGEGIESTLSAIALDKVRAYNAGYDAGRASMRKGELEY
jgi:hypothetical protein